MKALALAPYHLFTHEGMRFAFDCERLTFIRVDDTAYALLDRLLRGQTLAAVIASLGSEFGAAEADRVAREVTRLRQQGLLRGPVTTYDDGDYERQIARLVKMTTNKIELYLAEACNLRCRYCYVTENDAMHNGLMPWEVAKAAVDLVFRRGESMDSIQITFFGGEPLLNKPVMRRVIEYSQERGQAEGKKVMYSLTTNATLMDDEVIGWIKRHNFGLMVSMDGPPEVHDDNRVDVNGNGSFGRAAANVKRLMRRRRRVTARCTVSNRHLNLYDIVTFLEDFGFTRVGLHICQGKSYRLGPYDVGPQHRPDTERELRRMLERWLRQVKAGEELRYDPYSGTVRSVFKRERAPMLSCGVCRGCTTVGVDGNLYPCHRYVGMTHYVVGDVWTGVDETKHAHYLREYFKTKKKCETCWAVNACGGMCAWYVSHEDGYCVPPPDWRCDAIKRYIERSAWIYETVRTECPEYFEQIVREYDERRMISEGQPTVTRPDATRSRTSRELRRRRRECPVHGRHPSAGPPPEKAAEPAPVELPVAAGA